MKERKSLFLVLTGPSGSGKSTAIEGLKLTLKYPEVVIPIRATTRPARSTDKSHEVASVSKETFDDGVASGKIVIPHKIRDKWNGLIFPTATFIAEKQRVFIQALPTAAGLAIREQMSDQFDVLICRLKASKEVVLSRLDQRGPDDAPRDEAASRSVITPAGNDWTLDVEHDIPTVLNALKSLIVSCHNNPPESWRIVLSQNPLLSPVVSQQAA